MEKIDFIKIVTFIQGYFRKLSDDEIVALLEEVKDYSYDTFLSNFKESLLNDIDYFTVAKLHKIKEEKEKNNRFLESSGKSCWNDFYMNS